MIKREILGALFMMVASSGAVGVDNAVVRESTGGKMQAGPDSSRDELAASSSPSRVRYKVTDLGTLGGTSSEAFAINNAGLIVGSSETPDRRGFSHAFLSNVGKMTDLGVLEGHLQSEATGINKRGVIVDIVDSLLFRLSGRTHAHARS